MRKLFGMCTRAKLRKVRDALGGRANEGSAIMRNWSKGRRRNLRWVHAAICALLVCSPGRAAEPAGDRMRLIADRDTIARGVPFTLAVELQTQPGWHTYWLNPGDAGLTPTLRWRLPDGIRLARTNFPVPARFEDAGMVSLGYEGRVWILAEFDVAGEFQGEQTEISLTVDWMVCRDVCMPLNGAATIKLAVAAENAAPAAGKKVDEFARWRGRLPRPIEGWTVRIQSGRRGLRLRFEPPVKSGLTDEAWGRAQFYPIRRDTVDLAAAQKWRRDGAGWSAQLRAGPEPFKTGDVLEGVLVIPADPGAGTDASPRAWTIRTTVAGK